MENENKSRVASESPPEHSPITQSGHDTQAESTEGSTDPDMREDSYELRRSGIVSPQRKLTDTITEPLGSRKDYGRSWLWSKTPQAISPPSYHVSPLDSVLRHAKDGIVSLS